MSLAGDAQQQQQDLWVNVINRSTNQPYKTLWNCTSIQRWEQEEKELAKKVLDAFNEWIKVPGNDQKLKWNPNDRDGCGFKFVDGEFEYKLLEMTRKDGSGSFRTLGKRKIGAGGKGGYGNKPFTLLRTTEIKFMEKEELPRIFNEQGDNDNYEITPITDEHGTLYMIEKKEAYTPQLVTKDGNADGSKEEGQE